MFILFGWGKVTVRDYGPTVPATCSNCHNQGMQHYVHARTWFTLFFIPVIPYKSQRLLLCPVCQRGASLTAEQGERAIELGQATSQWHAGELPESEYLDKVSAFWQDVNPPVPDPTASPTPAAELAPPTDVENPTS